ncbi:hypothetical protein BX281_2280 [Streptomyces sp. Ag82_O1-15]|nr:hypothetical protein BX281_2280 [Streptomyces sp. Ag82_O1-15]
MPWISIWASSVFPESGQVVPCSRNDRKNLGMKDRSAPLSSAWDWANPIILRLEGRSAGAGMVQRPRAPLWLSCQEASTCHMREMGS